MKDFKCLNCGTLFGKESGDTLAIKYRDLYRIITGKVQGPCRGCGAVVYWPREAKDIS